MDDILAIGIAWMLLSATTAYIIGDKRSLNISFIAAAVMVVLGGDAWVDGLMWTVLFSPILLVVIPLARRRRRKAEKAGSGEVSATPPAVARSGATSGGQAGSDQPTWQDIQATREAERKASAQKRIEDLHARVLRDPVSAVLRRQVPIRFEEEPRSWLGGLPKMPDDVDWPRNTEDARPMHFAAQICCADLPSELWAKHGPRDGWILLFLDAFRMGSGDLEDDDCVVALHVDHLGPERKPPEDLKPVQDKMMSGADYWQPQEDVPNVWRKWPIDIIAQTQKLVSGQVIAFSERDLSTEPTTSQDLYGIEPQENAPILTPEECPPLTWGGVAAYLGWVLQIARARSEMEPSDQTEHLRSTPGWLGTHIADAEQEVTRLNASIPSFQERLETSENEQDRAQYRSAIERAKRYIQEEKATLEKLRAYAENGGEAALDAEIAANIQDYAEWWQRLLPSLEDLRDRIAREDPWSPLPADTWSAIKSVIDDVRRPEFAVSSRRDRPQTLRFEDFVLGDVAPWGGDVLRQHYLDLYTKSAAAYGLLPHSAKETLGEIARAINWDRPHRMGGLMDPLQGDIGPNDPPLLLQLASDDGMKWMWGDAGAVYVYADEAGLDTRRFALSCRLECH